MLLGAAQWANDNSGTTGVDSLAVKSLSKYYYDTEKFDNLRDDVKKKLKSIFVNWVDKGVEEVMSVIRREINYRKIMNPTENDKIELLKECGLIQ